MESFRMVNRDRTESMTSFASKQLVEVENFFLHANRLAPWKNGGGSDSGSFVKYSFAGPNPFGNKNDNMGQSYSDIPNDLADNKNEYGRKRSTTAMNNIRNDKRVL